MLKAQIALCVVRYEHTTIFLKLFYNLAIIHMY